MTIKHVAGTMLGAAVLALGCVSFAAGTASAAPAAGHSHRMAQAGCGDLATQAGGYLETAITYVTIGDVADAVYYLTGAGQDIGTLATDCVDDSIPGCIAIAGSATQYAVDATNELTAAPPDLTNGLTSLAAAGGYVVTLATGGCLIA